MKQFLTIILIFLTGILNAQETGILSGTILDAETKEALIGVNILTGENTTDNPRKLEFLEPQFSSGSSSLGAFVDPWGEPYRIALDTDYDGDVDINTDGVSETLRRKVAIVSVGLYELKGTGNTNDIIRSWP